MYGIARDTGWPEEFILWQLPLARGLQYYHCALQSANLWTLEPTTGDTIRELVPDSLIGYIDQLVAPEENTHG